MFFGLSGFLVAGSAKRLDLKNFLLNRSSRIFPALIVEIVLSALVLGPLVTTYPLAKYFTGLHFYTYFLNIFGVVQLKLPGVFLNNPVAEVVNSSIWTVPLEMGCYALISLLIVTKSLNNCWRIVGLAIVWVAVGYLYNHLLFNHQNLFDEMLRLAFSKRGPGLIPCFLMGIGLLRLLAFRKFPVAAPPNPLGFGPPSVCIGLSLPNQPSRCRKTTST